MVEMLFISGISPATNLPAGHEYSTSFGLCTAYSRQNGLYLRHVSNIREASIINIVVVRFPSAI